jgi:hypothetical protein
MSSHRVYLRCPHCRHASARPVGFVLARRTFVCNVCREVVMIDESEIAAALARLDTDDRGPPEVPGRALRR